MSKNIGETLENIGKVCEILPEFYVDGIKPLVQESGKLVALIPKTVNAALMPLRKWINEREYNLEETEKLIAKKLESVDANKIVTPEAYVAVPAIQAISYSMNSYELRNLYANLLSKSMNVDTKDFVHPAFVEIIKQMTPADASFLKSFYEGTQGTESTFVLICSPYYGTDIQKNQISYDNLTRLGLIKEYAEDIEVKYIPSSREGYFEIPPSIEMIDKGDDRYTTSITSVGKLFCEICL